MEQSTDEAFEAGVAAGDAGRTAEAYRLLLPLAKAGHVIAQSIVGTLIAYNLHRFESPEELNAAGESAVDMETARADLEEGGRFLEAASAAGHGPASFNLATLVVAGYGGGSWQERKDRAAALYALAHAQGFTAFGGLMRSEGPGQPYLQILEDYAADAGCPLPGEEGPDV